MLNIQDLKNLSYNSFFGSNLIINFLNGSPKKQLKFELIYLLLPLVLHEDSRKILSSLVEKSTIYTAFNNKDSFAGIEKRLQVCKNLTNKALILASNKNLIKIGNLITTEIELKNSSEKEPLLKDFYKASHNLGFIFSKSDCIDIFIELGIKEL